jgi:hypothetical protein
VNRITRQALFSGALVLASVASLWFAPTAGPIDQLVGFEGPSVPSPRTPADDLCPVDHILISDAQLIANGLGVMAGDGGTCFEVAEWLELEGKVLGVTGGPIGTVQ